MVSLRLPYKVVDGVDIPTDVHIPPSPAYTLAPVLIMIHGGGFILGFSKMNNHDQIRDCLQRGWIVVAIEHRLCPGVDVLEGPMADARDVLHWTQSGGLASALRHSGETDIQPEPDKVMVMGTSAGGHLSLSLVSTNGSTW